MLRIRIPDPEGPFNTNPQHCSLPWFTKSSSSLITATFGRTLQALLSNITENSFIVTSFYQKIFISGASSSPCSWNQLHHSRAGLFISKNNIFPSAFVFDEFTIVYWYRYRLRKYRSYGIFTLVIWIRTISLSFKFINFIYFHFIICLNTGTSIIQRCRRRSEQESVFSPASGFGF